MSHIRTIGSKGFWGVFFIALCAGVGLYACGSGSQVAVVSEAETTALPVSFAGTTTPISAISAPDPGTGNVTIAAPNTFSQGAIVVLNNTGSPALNGQQVVSSPTPPPNTVAPTFTVTVPAGTPAPPAPNPANPPTVTQPAGPVAGCTNSIPSSPITLAMLPSRISGVGPLAVFFDATATTATATARPFHELEYQWNFGDDDTVTWANGAHAFVTDTSNLKKKNRAMGPVAAHVFETPGTYTITLTIIDGPNFVSNACLQIVVGDPDVIFASTKTTCIAATVTPVAGAGGCPAGAAVAVQSDWPTIVNTYLGTSKRILLKGGDIFTGAANTSIAVTGPSMIGAYGTGKPILRTTGTAGSSAIISVSGTIADIRLVDLEIDGQSDGNRDAIDASNGAVVSNLLLLRLDIHHIGGGIDISLNQSAAPADGIALVDSTIRNISTVNANGHGILTAARKAAIMGNNFNDSTGGNGQHMIRIQLMDRGVISNNTVANVQRDGPPGSKEMMTIRAPCAAAAPCGSTFFGSKGVSGANAETKYVIASDNLIKTNTYIGIQLTQVTPTDSTLIHDVIIERNFLSSVTGSGGGIRILGDNVTARNNIINLTNGITAGAHGIDLDLATSGMAASVNAAIYNNTIVKNDVGTNFTGITINAGVTNAIVRNNLAYAPNAGGPSGVVSNSGTGTTSSNNTTQIGAESTLTSPSFVNASGLFNAPSDFNLNGGSYAIGAGSTSAPVFSDFVGVARPQGAGIDIGATEQ